MAEYIDREKFLKRLGEEYPGIPPHGAIVVGMLCDEEPADVRPVVHGTWEFMETENIWSHAELSHFYIQCSICKSQFFTDTPKLRFAYEFCPCCGADMREAEP